MLNFEDEKINEKQHLSDGISVQNILKTIIEYENLKLIMLLIICLFTYNLNMYGSQISFSFSGMGFGINNIGIGFIEILSYVYLYFTISRTQRILGVSIPYSLSLFLGVFFFFHIIGENPIVSSLLIGVIRLFISYVYVILGYLWLEYFQSRIKATAIGIIHGVSLLGYLLGPYIVSLANKNIINPLGILSLFFLPAIVTSCFLR